MSDQIQTKTLTNWYTFFRDVWLPYLVSAGFLVWLFNSPLGFFTSTLVILFMAGVVVLVAFNSWSTGREDGINYAMETLIANGILLECMVDGEISVKPASNVEIYSKCSKCGDGEVYNPSLTKQQNELGNVER